VCDITNELLHCDSWDPNETHSSIQSQIPSIPLTLKPSIPFAKALPLAVDVPTESIGKADNFIDDLIVTILGTPDNISRGTQPPWLSNSSAVHHTYTNPFSEDIRPLSANS
jgi:hypothetical protein